ncbi:MAG: hypothetical protein Lokiarch_33070 [Candidatus Lokiarchaeum sp. GC14_75]|nr:MAG: hypothetical protein Lokiarch_33070 [Candidatus Lokiarchaeum sp. GC14_75]
MERKKISCNPRKYFKILSNRKFKILGKRDYAKFGFRARIFIVYCDLILKFKSQKYRLIFKYNFYLNRFKSLLEE